MRAFLSINRGLGTLAALGLLACAVQAATPETTDSDQVQGGRDLSARLTVPVTINGGGPYHFVVDTGAERTVLSRELAQRLTLAPARRVTLLSIAGSDQVDTAMVAELRLTTKGNQLSDLEAPLLAEYHLGAVGMLGIDSLQTKRVILDFRKMRMTISDAPRRSWAADDEIVVTARRRLGQLILVDAEADGQKIAVIIDTGSAVSIGNAALRERLARRGKLGLSVPISITSVTGGQTPADYSSVKEIRIGGAKLKNMPIAFASPQIFHRLGLDRKPALLLGMDALGMFDRVSIDFANRNVRFVLPGEAWQVPPPRLAADAIPRRG
mgnify:CR=1 FL=1